MYKDPDGNFYDSYEDYVNSPDLDPETVYIKLLSGSRTDTDLVIQDCIDTEKITTIPILQVSATGRDLEDRIDIGLRELSSLVEKESI